MKELEYPFEAKQIISGKKRLRRLLLENKDDYLKKRIAILGGSTTNEIKDIMELFLLNQGIQPAFYESGYNQYFEEAVFPTKEFLEFSPDVIYVCTSNHNIERYPSCLDSEEVVEKLIWAEIQKYCAIWDKLEKRFHCPIIQNNFEMPAYRLLGNRDSYDYRGKTNFLMKLNMEFSRQAEQRSNLYLCDLNYVAADYGLGKWSDEYYYCMYKYAMHIEAVPYLAFQIANIIKSLFGKNKKGIVLDLDNTLWGGVVGDDGAEGIAIGEELPIGQIFLRFQQYIKEQTEIGVFLAVNSKNDYENAVAGLHHPDNALEMDDFVSFYANWKPKSQNMSMIAKELNVFPESLVFIDDNPAERFEVTGHIPGICAPEIGKVQEYRNIIDRSGFFEVTAFSDDDKNRVEMYQENKKRNQLQESFSDYSEYLRSLKMHADIGTFLPIYFSRIAQLSNKSNQFNLTTRRYTQEEIGQIAIDSSYITLYGRLEDRFGDNGLVSVVIGEIADKICHIRLWIMSCRVLKRGMEYAMMDSLIAQCKERGIVQIHGYYYPTAKNGIVKNFYAEMGFAELAGDGEGNTEWVLDLCKPYEREDYFITISRRENDI